MRVGFVFSFKNEDWLGGINYFRNLLSSIYDLPRRRTEPVIIVPSDMTPDLLETFPPFETLRTPLVESGRLLWKLRRGLQIYAGRDFIFESYLRKHQINLLSHSGHLGRSCTIPTLLWIADFQHLHLPELFSTKEQSAREAVIAEACEHASALLFSSKTAAADFSKMTGQSRARFEVLPFVATVPSLGSLVSLEDLERRYGFRGRYYFLPNQFWAHKNHAVVLEALALLKAQGHNFLVLATGNTNDYRQPDHYAALTRRVAELGIGDMFRPLGLVPYQDIMSLLRWSVALINPSLFEGWSTTVEEAKSMGKTVILSDIPTHREQSPERGKYFSPKSPDQLAALLVSESHQFNDAEDQASVDAAALQLPGRRQAFARRYEDIVLELVKPRPIHRVGRILSASQQ